MIGLNNDHHIKLAQAVCMTAHEAVGQKRKYTGEPYWHHPFKVAEIVAKVQSSSINDVVIAYLHDVLEDTQVTGETIQRLFGEDVYWGVFWLTKHYTKENYPNLNRGQRSDRETLRLAKASNRVQTIKIADMIDNTASIVAHDKKFASTYLEEKEEMLNWFIEADPILRNHAYQIIKNARKKLGL